MQRRGFCAVVSLFVAGALAQEEPSASPVEVEVVKEEQIVPTALALGTTEPKRRSVVAASIDGYVIDYPIKEGMRVESGVVLARLRDTVLRLQLRTAEWALAEVRELHKNAQRVLQRAQELLKTDVVTQEDLDARETNERTLALRILQAETRIESLKADIEKKTVTAPFAGQIVWEHTQIGEWLSRGGPVATLVEISSVYVRVNIPERHIRFVKEGENVGVSIFAASDKPLIGAVVSVADQGDPASRTFPVRVELKNDGQLRAGMSASVEYPAGLSQRSLVVSKDAILLRGTESYVFVVGEGNKAERRTVRTGAASGGKFAVLEGLSAGDRVVVKGNERVQSGAPLRIVEGVAQEPKRD